MDKRINPFSRAVINGWASFHLEERRGSWLEVVLGLLRLFTERVDDSDTQAYRALLSLAKMLVVLPLLIGVALGVGIIIGRLTAATDLLFVALGIGIWIVGTFCLWKMYRRFSDGLVESDPIRALVAFEKHEVARLNALDARHAENRDMAAEVLTWWHTHKDDPGMTKDRAASEIAGKVVPLKWRTVRDHLKGI